MKHPLHQFAAFKDLEALSVQYVIDLPHLHRRPEYVLSSKIIRQLNKPSNQRGFSPFALFDVLASVLNFELAQNMFGSRRKVFVLPALSLDEPAPLFSDLAQAKKGRFSFDLGARKGTVPKFYEYDLILCPSLAEGHAWLTVFDMGKKNFFEFSSNPTVNTRSPDYSPIYNQIYSYLVLNDLQGRIRNPLRRGTPFCEEPLQPLNSNDCVLIAVSRLFDLVWHPDRFMDGQASFRWYFGNQQEVAEFKSYLLTVLLTGSSWYNNGKIEASWSARDHERYRSCNKQILQSNGTSVDKKVCPIKIHLATNGGNTLEPVYLQPQPDVQQLNHTDGHVLPLGMHSANISPPQDFAAQSDPSDHIMPISHQMYTHDVYHPEPVEGEIHLPHVQHHDHQAPAVLQEADTEPGLLHTAHFPSKTYRINDTVHVPTFTAEPTVYHDHMQRQYVTDGHVTQYLDEKVCNIRNWWTQDCIRFHIRDTFTVEPRSRVVAGANGHGVIKRVWPDGRKHRSTGAWY